MSACTRGALCWGLEVYEDLLLDTRQVPGPNVTDYRRETYFEWDLGLSTRRQEQTRWSFVRTTADDNPSNTHHEDDTIQGNLGQMTLPGGDKR